MEVQSTKDETSMEETPPKKGDTKDYYYPKHGIKVNASSAEEASQKLAKLLKGEKDDKQDD